MDTADACNPVGVLLVHGLGGTQYDLGSLHKILKRAGVEAHTVTLPGHSGQPEDLLSVRAEDWVAVVEARYRELATLHPTLHVVAMCLGSLISIEAIKRIEQPSGKLVLLAPPVFLDGWATPWYWIFRHIVYRIPYFARSMKIAEEEPFGVKNDLVRAIVKAKFERGDDFHYPWVPLACIKQVDRLRSWIGKGLDAIRSPTLIIHAREDDLTSPRSAEFLVREMGDMARMVILENSYHMICVDNDRDQVAIEMLRHLELDTSVVKIRTRVRKSTPAE
ncbi:alpha/beta fold hydrolase [Jeongeupia wiesaeckerbachi]|uniref:alpha/beta hydrolase n=1 Tax=Jeongeupia wiesaeckerbachi TaxID=3051218 RepID=UPI003D809588